MRSQLTKVVATDFLYALAQGDVDTAIQFLDPAVELVNSEGAVYGIAEAARFIEVYEDGYEPEFGKRRVKETEEGVIDVGMGWHGTVAAGQFGASISSEAHLRLTFRDDKIVRFESFELPHDPG
jgi:ketosteroid isomerase-like protein